MSVLCFINGMIPHAVRESKNMKGGIIRLLFYTVFGKISVNILSR